MGLQAVCAVPGPAPVLAAIPTAPPTPPFPIQPNCWGSNARGQWGDGTVVGSASKPMATYKSVWKSLSMSSYGVCGIMAGSLTMYCWGTESGYGSLPSGLTATFYTPHPVAINGQWAQVFVGTYTVRTARGLPRCLGLYRLTGRVLTGSVCGCAGLRPSHESETVLLG